MRTSIAIATLLGAGALAQPRFRNVHRHHKRDQIKQWDEGGVHLVEDIVYVTVPPGQGAPAASPAASPIGQAKYVQNGNGGYQGQGAGQQPAPSPSVSVTQTPIIKYVQQQPSTQAASPSAAPSQVNIVQPQPQPQQQHTSAFAAAPAPSPSTNTQSSNAPSDGSYWASSPLSPPNIPGAQDVLSRANYWRTKWNPSLGPFTWSSTLAKNAYTTTVTPTTYTTDSNGQQVPHGEGGATVMGHMLNPGSNAQCIAGGGNSAMKGDLTPFDQAFLMWICEEPNGLAECAGQGGAGGGETGHAEIIKGKYDQIGCYWMGSDKYGGMWTCDFTTSGNQ